MKITNVFFIKYVLPEGDGFKGECTVMLDDVLVICNLRLHKKENKYFLIMPSKQTVYRDVKEANPDVFLQYPEKSVQRKAIDKNKVYEEFYHPVSKEFYEFLLSSVVNKYLAYCKSVSSGENIEKQEVDIT